MKTRSQFYLSMSWVTVLLMTGVSFGSLSSMIWSIELSCVLILSMVLEIDRILWRISDLLRRRLGLFLRRRLDLLFFFLDLNLLFFQPLHTSELCASWLFSLENVFLITVLSPRPSILPLLLQDALGQKLPLPPHSRLVLPFHGI